MSLLFTHYDRTSLCNHEGMLGRVTPEGMRMCCRCGKTITPEPESFTEPVGRKSDRRAIRTAVG